MSAIRLNTVACAVSLALASPAAFASGFALQNQTGSGNGNAFAGAAAAAEDAGTIFFNPAGMAYLPQGHNISLAGTLLSRSINYSDKGSIAGAPFSLGTTNGGDAGGLSLIPSGYWAYSINQQLSVGVGISPTFGNKTEYNFDFVGRNAGFFAEITQININPSIAYKLNENVSLGAGLNIAHNETHFKQGVAVVPFPNNYLDVKGDAWAVGYNLGAMFQLTPNTRLGIAYRSELKFDLEGQQSVSQSTLGNPLLANTNIKATLKTPASTSLALSHKPNDRLELLADITWTEWSVINTIQLQRQDTGANLSSLSYNFKDTWRVGFGANYQYNDAWKLRFGIAYDKSPVKSAADRTMTLPDSDRTWLAFGAKYKLSPVSSIDFGYAHIFFKDTSTARAVPNSTQVIIGSWDNSADLLSMQYNHKF